MAPTRNYGAGFLGCGSVGRAHAYCHAVLQYYFPDMPFRTRLVEVCTSRPETAERARDALGSEFATTDPAEIIENEAVDVVHICTPNALHKDQLLAVMKAGKHVYCEKPLTRDWAEAKDVLRALRDYRGVHQVTFQNRFYPATVRAKQLADEGFLGDVTCFRAVFLHSSNLDPKRPAGWKFQQGSGVQPDGAELVERLRRDRTPRRAGFHAPRVRSTVAVAQVRRRLARGPRGVPAQLHGVRAQRPEGGAWG